ncbi:uncharacterized protein LOC131638990 isoform X1 [Vicia villosa]|uniref:uncharacterized protein LOC131638990 isoform X1 n=1 Tax=Vicia villosa TaxID=3911 RepID=UPI00273C1772|nr:uncharacterized protein LOC131638990 isoform X1 [Vicia villosa]XP_058765499.1 uncharacterized protein LOC131638990 isoform X1 [Vicia villosa]XP_058765500.1 uncharacterized protein LOC131638990 isoform X1 [Vicia villosa]XP_058765501.1 uncharacterized protein LOC131638990 isoform X1 [Vicia villosa]XP_058765502.1 uncharacterized protein LOC131638990 isoform X1 [Vicia villosa]
MIRVGSNDRQNGFTKYESSDSAASSEFSSTQVGSVNGTLPKSRAYMSAGYASSVPSRMNQQNSAEKRCMCCWLAEISLTLICAMVCFQNGRLSDGKDIPSAPSFCGSTQGIRPTNEQISTSTARSTPNNAESSTLKSVTRDKFENHGDASSEQLVRPATGSDGAASSNPQPPRLPTFHASALGPWQAVIAYDACARLCLHAWAMQCTEAPMFLENECFLLRDAFGLRQVLLQPEEELLVKCNAELSSEGVVPKPKYLLAR